MDTLTGFLQAGLNKLARSTSQPALADIRRFYEVASPWTNVISLEAERTRRLSVEDRARLAEGALEDAPQ